MITVQCGTVLHITKSVVGCNQVEFIVTSYDIMSELFVAHDYVNGDKNIILV
jgi:hypothetical protein